MDGALNNWGNAQKPDTVQTLKVTAGANTLEVPGGDGFLRADFAREGFDLILDGAEIGTVVVPDYFLHLKPPALVSGDGAVLEAATVRSLAGPMAPAQVAQISIDGIGGAAVGAETMGEPIGTVSESEGAVSVMHPDGTEEMLPQGSPIYQGDVIQTGKDGAVSVIFVDDTVFSLENDGRMVMDEMVYDPDTQEGTFNAQIVQGVFSMVSGQVAKTSPDGMSLSTPTATIGIRGSTLVLEMGEDGSVQNATLVNDVDGNIGEIVLVSPTGQSVTLNQFGASTSIGANGNINPVKILSQTEVQEAHAKVLTKVVKAVAKVAEQKVQQTQQKAQEAEQAKEQADQAKAEAEDKLAEAEASGDEEAIAEAQAELDVAEQTAQQAEAQAVEAQAQAAQAQQFNALASTAVVSQEAVLAQVTAQQPAPDQGNPDGPVDGPQNNPDDAPIDDAPPPDPVVEDLPPPLPDELLPPQLAEELLPPPPPPPPPPEPDDQVRTPVEDDVVVNLAPQANSQTLSDIVEDSAAITGRVTATDPDGGPQALTYTLKSVTGGTVDLLPGGSYTFTPLANYVGPAGFTFTASDGPATSNVGQVSFNITGTNDAPVFTSASSISLSEDTVYNGTIAATDPDAGDSVSYSASVGPTYGSLTVNSDGTYTYTPDANFTGSDSFTVQATDGTLSSTQVVSVTVNDANDAPVITSASAITAYEDTTFTGLVTATDPDPNSSISFSVSANPTNGSLTLNSDGSYTYTPGANYTGSDSFTVEASDGSLTDTQVVNVTVASSLIAATDSVSATQDVTAYIPFSALLTNDTSLAGRSLDISSVAAGTNGTVEIIGDYVHFTPTGGYSGAASFTYVLTDGVNSSTSTTVNVTVAAPTAASGSVVNGTSGSDLITGTAGNDILNGGDGYDIIDGGTGDDVISSGHYGSQLTGGLGTNKLTGSQYLTFNDASQIDTAVYSGAQADYTITQNADYTYTITGTGLHDTLVYMDQLKFLNNGGTATYYQLGRSAYLHGSSSTASGGDGDDSINGTAGADTISTGAGNDIVNGGDGYDIIDGGAGDDVLSSGHYGSELTGGTGTNKLTGSQYLTFNDVEQIDTAVYSGAQADYTITQNADYTYTITGTGVYDTLVYMEQLKFLNNGGTVTYYQLGRNAYLHGSGSTASGGDGDDTMSGTAGADTISAGAGNDVINGGDGHDIINGGAGDDILSSGHYGSELTGGTGTNILTGSQYLTFNDVEQIDTAVYSGAQADYTITQNADYTYTITGTGVYDTLVYMEQLKFLNNGGTATYYQLGRNAYLHGSSSTASGGDGDDTINGTAGADTISTGAGNDVVNGGDGLDIIDGGAGDDILSSGHYGSELTGGTGTNILTGSQYLTFNDGVQIDTAVYSGAQADYTITQNADYTYTITGTGVHDTLVYMDQLKFLNDGGTATFYQLGRNAYLHGSSSTASGGDGDDSINGTAGVDTISTGAGNDIVNGGDGLDIIDGGAGDDILSSNGGSELTGGTGTNRLVGSQSATTDTAVYAGAEADYTITRNADYTYTVTGTDIHDTLVYMDQLKFLNNGGTATYYALDTATDTADDRINGTSSADTYSTGAGDDVVVGNDGYDIIDGGAGNDSLSSGQNGSELTGGTGTNTLSGSSLLTWGGVLQTDTAVYAGAQADYTITQNADYTYTITGTDIHDTLTYMDQLKFLNNGGTATYYQLGRKASLDGTSNTADGGEGNDYITGSDYADTVSMGAGDDYMYTKNGTDIIDGGAGDDVIINGQGGGEFTGGTGTNKLTGSSLLTWGGVTQIDTAVYAGAQADYTITQNADYTYTITGTDLHDTLTYMDQLKFLNNGGTATYYQLGRKASLDGTSNTADGGEGNDYITGSDYADTVSMGAGDDYMYTKNGVDVIDGGAGDDVIINGQGGGEFTGGTGTNKLTGSNLLTWGGVTQIDTAVYAGAQADYTITQNADYTYTITGTDIHDTLTYMDQLKFLNNGGTATYYQLGRKESLDGTSNTADGGEGNDYITGSDYADTVSMGAGDDYMYTKNGTDIIDGGAGDDVIINGQGGGEFTGGTGTNKITGSNLLTWGDVLQLDTAVYAGAEGDYTITQNDDYTYTVTGTDVHDTLTNMDQLKFLNNGGTATYYELARKALLDGSGSTASGGVDDDYITGTAGNDTISTLEGDDIVFGNDGDDIIIGGAGADTLSGGNGADVFQYAAATDSSVGAGDSITDFTSTIDQIDISAISGGSFDFGTISSASGFTVQAQQTGTKVEFDIDDDGVVDMEIDVGAATIAVGDFVT